MNSWVGIDGKEIKSIEFSRSFNVISSLAKFIYKYSYKIYFNELYFSESIKWDSFEIFELMFYNSDPTN